MPGPLELILILVVVILIFGTKKLRNMGGDLGAAIKNFKSAAKEGENDQAAAGKQIDDDAGETPQSSVDSNQEKV